MNTRYAKPDAPLSQERYMSSPEYAELRGISGNAVAAKAAIISHPAKRSLLFFLQAMSLKQGGLKKLGSEFLAMFPDRFGSETMHRVGTPSGGRYTLTQGLAIHAELGNDAAVSRLKWAAGPVRKESFDWLAEEIVPRNPLTPEEELELLSVAALTEHCRREARNDRRGVEAFVIELCVNPRYQFSAPGELEASLAQERVRFSQEIDDRDGLRPVGLCYFRDIIGALFEYKKRYEKSSVAGFVMTEVAQKTFETLDIGLATGKMVVVQGNSRIGKTTATEAWVEQHLGEVRMLSLSGITSKTIFFRQCAKALGLGSGYSKSSTEMQSRIEDVLQRSRLMLVIDEAHHLFSSAERVYSRPDLIDWINTAVVNHHVPCALVCTPQFGVRMARAEKQTSWNSDQLQGRTLINCLLPSVPVKRDLEAVARHRMPFGSDPMVNYVVGYALSAKLAMPAVVDTISIAQQLAARSGRDQVTFADLERAVTDYVSCSAVAMEEAANPPGRRAGRPAKRPEAPTAMAPELELQDRCKAPAMPQNGPRQLGRKTNLSGLAPGQNAPSVNRRQDSVLSLAPEAA